MISRHIVVVFRHHKVTSDRTLQVIFFCKLLYGEPLPLTSVPIIRWGKTRYQISGYIRCMLCRQLRIRSPSAQSSFVEGNCALILFINEKHVAVFSGIFRRCRTDVLCQDFAFSYVLFRYISHEPVSKLSIVSSPPRCIRIYNKIHLLGYVRILRKKNY